MERPAPRRARSRVPPTRRGARKPRRSTAYWPIEFLERVHEQHFEPTHGPLRRVAREAVGRFLDCGLFEHGFARVRCTVCRAIGFVTEPAVAARILTHLPRRGVDARAGPWTGAVAAPG